MISRSVQYTDAGKADNKQWNPNKSPETRSRSTSWKPRGVQKTAKPSVAPSLRRHHCPTGVTRHLYSDAIADRKRRRKQYRLNILHWKDGVILQRVKQIRLDIDTSYKGSIHGNMQYSSLKVTILKRKYNGLLKTSVSLACKKSL